MKSASALAILFQFNWSCNISNMSKKKFLKLLIKSYGLTPFNIEEFDTELNETSKNVEGWRGKGIDENNDVAIDFNEKAGFNSAVYEILVQADSAELVPKLAG
jgi:hypothetical protein